MAPYGPDSFVSFRAFPSPPHSSTQLEAISNSVFPRFREHPCAHHITHKEEIFTIYVVFVAFRAAQRITTPTSGLFSSLSFLLLFCSVLFANLACALRAYFKSFAQPHLLSFLVSPSDSSSRSAQARAYGGFNADGCRLRFRPLMSRDGTLDPSPIIT